MKSTLLVAATALVLGLSCSTQVMAADDDHGRGHDATQQGAPEQPTQYRGHKADNPDWGEHGRFRTEMKAPKPYHMNTKYQGPSGFAYHQWHHGDRLPREYYARDYWLTDFLTFGLFAPPEGLVWVRYGDDALLIDEETGEVIQVRYNVFES
jgi:Ni/Co efflux regulator RcnB